MSRLPPRLLRILFTISWLAWCAPAVRADPPYKSTVAGNREDPEELAEERATTVVTRAEMDKRLPRSAPDALRYEPGVFVQQTAHGQGSAFIRGLTGQQTLMMFDGIRLNNSTYRQGPNQYFFTLDARTIRSIEVERGGGSTRWGSDALGGVIDAHPIDPSLGTDPLTVDPRAFARMTTADNEYGGRAQLELRGGREGGFRWGLLGGVGARSAGLINGPPVLNPDPATSAGLLPWVPRYQGYDPTKSIQDQLPNLRVQLGTGFQEITGDGRLVLQFTPDHRVTLAAYAYREFNSPRTDQCPPPQAQASQCTTYEEQFRTLVYGAWNAHLGRAADQLRVTFSWQQQHEKRRLDLTTANAVFRGIDDVDTFGFTARAETDELRPAGWLGLSAAYGLDTYFDSVHSRLSVYYTDLPQLGERPQTRGQYLDGGNYLYGGAFGDLKADLGSRFTLRGGARLSWIAASAPGDPQSGSAEVHRAWVPVVGHAGVEFKPWRPLRLFVNYDNSYRAPNLDDMTSRQQTGPGFQFENPALEPEHANTFELGARLRTPWVWADAWLFESLIDNAIIKVSKLGSECPPMTDQCNSSWSRFQLQNSPTPSELRGAEGAVKVFIPYHFSVRATISYVWSEGPRVGMLAKGVFGVVLGERVPLSRTPPLNGTVELAWAHPGGFTAGASLQWADAQTHLSIADYSDGRIPKYGTPGYAVVHLRAAYRLRRNFLVSAVLENLFDSPYRFHGSSVNGAGRGLMVQLEASPFI